MKQPKKVAPSFSAEPRTAHQESKRHEIDALIQGISAFLKKKPEKVIKVLELWANDPKSREKTTVRKKAG